MNETAVREVFAELGLRASDDIESEVAQAEKLLSMDGVHPYRRAVAERIVAAAGMEVDPPRDEAQKRVITKTEDARFENLWSLAAQVVDAKLRLGSERVSEIIDYCHQNHIDLSACLRAEIERVEAIPPNKKTARAASSRPSH